MERRASPRLGQQTGSNHLAEKPKKARENREEPWICSGVHSGFYLRVPHDPPQDFIASNYIAVILRGDL